MIMAIFVAALATTQVSAQDTTALTAADIRRASMSVRTIDPKDEDYSDLEPLAAKLKDTRVLVLGERSHRAGASNLAKVRLIKFLHKRLGFDVVIMELDMLMVREGMGELVAGVQPSEVTGGLGTHSNVIEHDELYRYVTGTAATARPLTLAGMDPWYVGGASKNVGQVITTFFEKAGGVPIPPDILTILRNGNSDPYISGPGTTADLATSDYSVFSRLVTLIDKNRTALVAAHGENEVEFFATALRNRATFARIHEPLTSDRRSEVPVPRETGMGNALDFLVNRYYSGRKVIVWASHSHTMRNGSELGLAPATFLNATEYLAQKTPSGLATVGFTSNGGGSVLPPNIARVERTAPGSLEWAAHEVGPELQWIDLHALPGSYRAKFWPASHLVAEWKRHFDYAFFLNSEQPLTPRAGEDLPTTSEQRAQYVGIYDFAPRRLLVRIFERENRLYVQIGAGVPLPVRYRGSNRFDAPAETKISMTFATRTDGARMTFKQGSQVLTLGRRQ